MKHKKISHIKGDSPESDTTAVYLLKPKRKSENYAKNYSYYMSFFICSASAYSSSFSIYETSVCATGMLGAFSAYADHVSTIYYNPAGLGGLDGIRISGSATIISPRSTFRNLSPLAPIGQKTEMEKQNFTVPNFYGSHQITDNLTAGIGVYAPFGLGTKWPEDWVGRGSSIETIFCKSHCGIPVARFRYR